MEIYLLEKSFEIKFLDVEVFGINEFTKKLNELLNTIDKKYTYRIEYAPFGDRYEIFASRSVLYRILQKCTLMLELKGIY